MGTSLFNTTPAATYPALIKVGNNTSIDGTLKTLSDGAGNDLPIQVSSTVTNFTGNVGIGTTTPTSKLVVAKTSGSLDAVFTTTDATSATTIYEDNDLGKGIRIQSYGSTASGTLLDGTINRAGSVVIRTNDTDYPTVFGGLSNSSERYYFGKTAFTLALNTTTNNVSIGASSGTARLEIKGSGSTSATTALSVANSAGTLALQVLDDSRVVLGNSSDFAVYSGSAITVRYAMSIGTTSLPAASAALEVVSTTQCFLPPRMTTAQRLAIASPPNGLIVFDTDVQNLCYRRDSTWVQASFTAV